MRYLASNRLNYPLLPLLHKASALSESNKDKERLKFIESAVSAHLAAVAKKSKRNVTKSMKDLNNNNNNNPDDLDDDGEVDGYINSSSAAYPYLPCNSAEFDYDSDSDVFLRSVILTHLANKDLALSTPLAAVPVFSSLSDPALPAAVRDAVASPAKYEAEVCQYYLHRRVPSPLPFPNMVSLACCADAILNSSAATATTTTPISNSNNKTTVAAAAAPATATAAAETRSAAATAAAAPAAATAALTEAAQYALALSTAAATAHYMYGPFSASAAPLSSALINVDLSTPDGKLLLSAPLLAISAADAAASVRALSAAAAAAAGPSANSNSASGRASGVVSAEAAAAAVEEALAAIRVEYGITQDPRLPLDATALKVDLRGLTSYPVRLLALAPALRVSVPTLPSSAGVLGLVPERARSHITRSLAKLEAHGIAPVVCCSDPRAQLMATFVGVQALAGITVATPMPADASIRAVSAAHFAPLPAEAAAAAAAADPVAAAAAAKARAQIAATLSAGCSLAPTTSAHTVLALNIEHGHRLLRRCASAAVPTATPYPPGAPPAPTLLVLVRTPVTVTDTADAELRLTVPSVFIPLLPCLGVVIDLARAGTGVPAGETTAFGVQSFASVHAALAAQRRGFDTAPAPVDRFLHAASLFTVERVRVLLDLCLLRTLTSAVAERVRLGAEAPAPGTVLSDRTLSTLGLLFLNLCTAIVVKADRMRTGAIGVNGAANNTATGTAGGAAGAGNAEPLPSVLDSWRYALMREREHRLEKLAASEVELSARLTAAYGHGVVSGQVTQGPLAEAFRALWAAYEREKAQFALSVAPYKEKVREMKNAIIAAQQQQAQQQAQAQAQAQAQQQQQQQHGQVPGQA